LRVLGIDPGGTTGYCLLNADRVQNSYRIEDMGEVKSEQFYDWLDNWPTLAPTVIVCEDWKQRPKFDGLWTDQPVAEQKGAIAYRTHQLCLPFIVLQPADKPKGYRCANLTYKQGKKGTHIEDACAHAFYVAKLGYTKNQRKF
jgi:hypothetical protein